MNTLSKIDDLEDNGLWKSALDLASDEIVKKPSKEIAIRRAFICWYVLIEWGCIGMNEPCDSEEFENGLVIATEYLLKQHPNDAEVNFYLGYMVSIAPWLFGSDADAWESKATTMLSLASKSEPNNAIYQMVYMGNQLSTGKEYDTWCKKAEPMVSNIYRGKGEFNLYFRQVLTRETVSAI